MKPRTARLAVNSGVTEDSRLIRAVAASAGLAGLLLIAYTLLMAAKPPGCIAEECVGQAYRAAGPLEATLGLATLLLLMATALGLYRIHRFDGRGTKLVRIVALIAAASLLIAVLGLLVSAMFFGGDSGLIYFVAIFPGLLLAMVAFAVIGAGLISSHVVPEWSAGLLILSSLLLLVHNDQNERIFLLIPFGATLVIVGLFLWSATTSSSSRLARIQHA